MTEVLFDARCRAIRRAVNLGRAAEYASQPPESIWNEALAALAELIPAGDVWRADGVLTTCPKTRDLGGRVLRGLTIMRDDDSDEDDWALPDLDTINRAISALGALVQRAEDADRCRNALKRIAREWTDQPPDAIRQYARSVVAGGSARVPLEATSAQAALPPPSTAPGSGAGSPP